MVVDMYGTLLFVDDTGDLEWGLERDLFLFL